MGAHGENLLSAVARRPFLSLTGAVSVVSLAAHAASAEGIPVTNPGFLALLLAAGLVAYGLRTVTHAGYYVWRGSNSWLRCLVGVEVGIAIAWYHVSRHAVAGKDPRLVAVAGITLLVAVGLVAALVTRALEDTNLVDASTRIEKSALGELLQEVMMRLRFDGGLVLFGRHGPAEEVSACLILICALLAFIG